MKDLRFEFDIEGRHVELLRIDPRVRGASLFGSRNDESKPAEQRLYEIRIDDALVGLASKPFGFGKMAYSIEKLGKGANVGNTTAFSADHHPHADRLFDFEQIARKAVELRAKHDGRLHALFTVDELNASSALAAVARIKKAEDEKRRQEERIAARAAKRIEEDLHFEEMTGGLRSIDERFGSDLNNYELNALRAAIEHYEREKATVLQNRRAFED